MSRNNAGMNKVTVTDSLYLYVFTDKEAKHQDSIMVIVQDNSALLTGMS